MSSPPSSSSPPRHDYLVPSFPPTPSRTTSQISITSVDAHLSPPQNENDNSPRRRSHSNPNFLHKSNDKSVPSTPTKRKPNHGNGLLDIHNTGHLTLRSRASTSTSVSRATIGSSSTINKASAISLFDNLPNSTSTASASGLGTPNSALSKDFEGLNLEQQSKEGNRPPSSKKGKEKARSLQDLEDDVQVVEGELSRSAGDLKKGLRDLVRRNTITKTEDLSSKQGVKASTINLKDTKDDPRITDQLAEDDTRKYTPRKYYVLTNAGKPVFSSPDNSSEDNITELVAIASTLISIFQEDDDKIRCMIKGKTRIGFLLKSPLYLFAVSDWSEPEHILRSHLEYIYLQILSVISSTQLLRVFQRRSNFDLSRLLEGTETFLNKLIDRAQFDFSYLTATLQPLRMNPATRDTAGAALMPPNKFKDLLYVLLVANGRIVTLLRPKKHAVHPSDLHLLLNTLASSSTLRSSETWLPICFPKFNPAGFVHAYISYVTEDVGLVFVSADREAFEDLRSWKSIVLEKLENDRTLAKITEAIPLHPYTVSAIGCPGLRHFIYKSRQYIQITQPEWEAPYTEESIDRKRLITLYQRLHDVIHARSGQSQTYKLVYMRTEHEACLAWLTKPFELYLTVSPQLSKSAVVATANTVAKWVLSEEGRVFLKDAPVF
ncbi:uncharacterized protein L201_001947 [Kwoniella dendrophila CBS 6074]|uniref:Vacuolar fusion protein MON1 n=1 Tax=Kwoniella dendrophila CBS 6074 TaxID=1295534 RepID=A0AAX4JNW6_9TREE